MDISLNIRDWEQICFPLTEGFSWKGVFQIVGKTFEGHKKWGQNESALVHWEIQGFYQFERELY